MKYSVEWILLKFITNMLFLDAFLHLYKKVCQSVGHLVVPSVTYEFKFLRNALNLNQIAPGIRKYVI